ncbi:MAG: hypothetical protein U0L09_02355 [Christensenellales bacterium]|nr:hypothetical protein [Christensenellales bacterium]
MIRNDYRRSLILLRNQEPGFSGHVRLERRTLLGSMFFSVKSATEGRLCATLIRRDREGTYFAVRLGNLKRDSRGMASMVYSFDPRNIDGRTLEEYILIAVVLVDAENCNLVLTGNLNGSREVSWPNVRAAACSVCDCGRAPDSARPYPQPRSQQDELDDRNAQEQTGFQNEDAGKDRSLEADGSNNGADGVADVEEQPQELAKDATFPMETMAASLEAAAEAPVDDAAVLQIAEAPSASSGVWSPAAAGEALGIDLSVPWPGVSEQLRELFCSQPALDLMLNDGYIYVRGEMPEGTGYEYVGIGVRVEDGIPFSVSYALPSRFSVEPPPGLEEYRWQGGAADGWWTLYTDAATGEPIS